MNLCSHLHLIEDRIERVFNGKNKAGSKLAKLPPCVHQSGGVWEKLKVAKHMEEVIPYLFAPLVTIHILSPCNKTGNPLKHLVRGFHSITTDILDEISFFQN